jgi:MYXO-CTERM domain-containing protein
MSLRTWSLVAVVLTSSGVASAQTLDAAEQGALKIEGWLNGVSNVMDLGFTPDGRVIIAQNSGEILIRNKDGMVSKGAGTVPIKRLTATEHGLLGVVVDPNFAQNHTVYFHASIGATVADKNQIFRATLSDDNKFTFDYANPLYKFESPEKHNGSMMAIHKGYLYIAIGDSGGDASPPVIHYPSCLNKPNGKILRMGLDGSAPADNPLSNLAMVTGCTTENRLAGAFSMQPPEKRIWAWGFRQPYRFWIDPVTDLVWVGDVGEKAKEEVDIVSKGQHHGYPFEEGSVKYNQPWKPAGGCTGMVPSTACTPPTYQYDNGSGGDGCVIGGFILDGCGWPEAYKSRYLYGDFNAGHLYTVQVTPDRKGIVAGSRKAFGTFRTINGFRMGPDGAVYLTAFDAAAIYRVTPKDMPASCASAPAPDAGAPPSDASVSADDAGAAGGEGGGAAGEGGGSGGGGGGTGGGSAGKGGTPGGGGAGKGGSTGGAGSGAGGDEGGGEEGGKSGGGSKPAKSGGCAVGGGGPGAGWLLLGVALALAVVRRRARRHPTR